MAEWLNLAHFFVSLFRLLFYYGLWAKDAFHIFEWLHLKWLDKYLYISFSFVSLPILIQCDLILIYILIPFHYEASNIIWPLNEMPDLLCWLFKFCPIHVLCSNFSVCSEFNLGCKTACIQFLWHHRSLVFLCILWHWHFWKVQANYIVECSSLWVNWDLNPYLFQVRAF